MKELVRLPLRTVQSGEEFLAKARKEISVFGAILSEREGDAVLWTWVLIISEVLDHTCTPVSQLHSGVEGRRLKPLSN